MTLGYGTTKTATSPGASTLAHATRPQDRRFKPTYAKTKGGFCQATANAFLGGLCGLFRGAPETVSISTDFADFTDSRKLRKNTNCTSVFSSVLLSCHWPSSCH